MSARRSLTQIADCDSLCAVDLPEENLGLEGLGYPQSGSSLGDFLRNDSFLGFGLSRLGTRAVSPSNLLGSVSLDSLLPKETVSTTLRGSAPLRERPSQQQQQQIADQAQIAAQEQAALQQQQAAFQQQQAAVQQQPFAGWVPAQEPPASEQPQVIAVASPIEGPKENRICRNCKQRGHIQVNCPLPDQRQQKGNKQQGGAPNAAHNKRKGADLRDAVGLGAVYYGWREAQRQGSHSPKRGRY